MLKQSRRVVIEHRTVLESCQAIPPSLTPRAMTALLQRARVARQRKMLGDCTLGTLENELLHLDSNLRESILERCKTALHHSLCLWILPTTTESIDGGLSYIFSYVSFTWPLA